MKQFLTGVSRLGRSTLVGPGVFLPSLLWAVVLHFSDSTAKASAFIPLRIGLVVIAHALMFNVIYVVRKYAFPPKNRRFEFLGILAILLLASAFRGIVMQFLIDAFGVSNFNAVHYKVLVSMQNMTVVILVCALITESVREWSDRTAELERENSRLVVMLSASTQQIEQAHDVIVATVTGQLYRFLHELEKVSPENLVSSLRTGIADIVRPLSRSVGEAEPILPPITQERVRLRFSKVLLEVGFIQPLDTLVVPLGLIFISFPYFILYFPPNLVFVAILGFFAVSVAVQFPLRWAYKAIAPTSALASWGLLLVSVFLRSLFGNAAFAFFFGHLRAQRTWTFYLILAFGTIFAVIYALLKSVNRQLNLVETRLRKTRERLNWEVSRSVEVQRQQSRALAIAIHGPVQTAVGAGIIRLERAMLAGPVSAELIEEVKEQIWTSLDRLNETSKAPLLTDVFEEVATTWEDVCKIKVVAAKGTLKALAYDAIATQLISDLVPELVFNAIKHSAANWIKVSVLKPVSNTITLRVEYDGSQYEEVGKRGLGLRYLQDAALSVKHHWLAGKNLVTVLLPYQDMRTKLPPPRA